MRAKRAAGDREVIRLGVIGGGMMSQVGHLPFFVSDPRCEVVAVAESRPSLVAALTGDFGVARVVPHHREILGDPDIDAVVISAPRPATALITEEALEAGKHVLAEKPMALTSGDAARLVDLAREKGLTYAVGFMKRYDPGIEAGRAVFSDLIDTGRLGTLLAARFHDFSRNYAMAPPAHTRPAESRAERFPTSDACPAWLPAAFQGDWEWFLNAGSHDLNLIHFFFPDTVDVVAAAHPCPGAIAAILRWRDVAITLEVVKSAIGVWREGAEFVFENGCLTLDIPSPMAVDGVTRARLEENIDQPTSRMLETGSGWSFARQASGFLGALSGGSPPAATGADALRDMRLNDAIWKRIVAADD
jgi:predicted dehydrogenase